MRASSLLFVGLCVAVSERVSGRRRRKDDQRQKVPSFFRAASTPDNQSVISSTYADQIDDADATHNLNAIKINIITLIDTTCGYNHKLYFLNHEDSRDLLSIWVFNLNFLWMSITHVKYSSVPASVFTYFRLIIRQFRENVNNGRLRPSFAWGDGGWFPGNSCASLC